MVFAIGFATIITKKLIDRNDSNPGVIIKSWDGILKNISNDIPDCENQRDVSKPNCPAN